MIVILKLKSIWPINNPSGSNGYLNRRLWQKDKRHSGLTSVPLPIRKIGPDEVGNEYHLSEGKDDDAFEVTTADVEMFRLVTVSSIGKLGLMGAAINHIHVNSMSA